MRAWRLFREAVLGVIEDMLAPLRVIWDDICVSLGLNPHG